MVTNFSAFLIVLVLEFFLIFGNSRVDSRLTRSLPFSPNDRIVFSWWLKRLRSFWYNSIQWLFLNDQNFILQYWHQQWYLVGSRILFCNLIEKKIKTSMQMWNSLVDSNDCCDFQMSNPWVGSHCLCGSVISSSEKVIRLWNEANATGMWVQHQINKLLHILTCYCFVCLDVCWLFQGLCWLI